MEEERKIRDRYIEDILVCTSYEPMSPQMISAIYGIPIATCFKKIKLLERYGLVHCVKTLAPKGNGGKGNGGVKIYRASEDKVKIEQENGRTIVKINVPFGIAFDLSQRWNSHIN
jgi:hypothetical protein